MKVQKKYTKARINIIRGQLLKAIRGTRTQGQVYRRLGLSFNLVYRWEKGSVGIGWDDFLGFCQACGLDGEKSMTQLLARPPRRSKVGWPVVELVGTENLTLACKSFGVSRFVLANWLKGATQIPLEAILYHLAGRWMLVKFISLLVDISQVPELAKEARLDQRQRELRYQRPWATVLAMGFGMQDYRALSRHRPGYVGKKIGLSLQEESELLAMLVEANMLDYVDEKYIPVEEIFDTRGDFKGQRQARIFWAMAGLDKYKDLEGPSKDDIFGNYIFDISEEAFELVHKAYVELVQKVQDIWAQDGGNKKYIKVLNVQLFDSRGCHLAPKGATKKSSARLQPSS